MSTSKELADELRRATVDEGEALVSNSMLARAANRLDAYAKGTEELRTLCRRGGYLSDSMNGGLSEEARIALAARIRAALSALDSAS